MFFYRLAMSMFYKFKFCGVLSCFVFVYMLYLISRHSKTYFASKLFISEFSCENKKINCVLGSVKLLKPGRIALTFWYNSDRVIVYRGHVVMKCSSFSSVCKHVGHFRSYLAIMDLFFLPSSIISLWSDTRNFVKATLCFLFLICER